MFRSPPMFRSSRLHRSALLAPAFETPRASKQLFAILALALFAFLLAPIPQALAGKDPVYTSWRSNVAAGGADVVAYFTQNAYVEGTKTYSTSWNGADWHFASAENLDAFEADPEAYAPQYGGYCAWAMAQGYFAAGKPPYWTVHNDKLYLNFNQKVQNDWLEDVDSFIEQADANWPGILD